jgi:hypothetical protein
MLRDWRDGDEQALEQLVPLVYEELRGLARRELRRDRPVQTLQPTELVHDAYARIAATALFRPCNRPSWFTTRTRA